MSEKGFMGLSHHQSNTLIVVLLFAILGIVSFNFYFNVSTDDGIAVKTGGGFVVLPGKKQKRMMHHHQMQQQQEGVPAEYVVQQ